MAIHGVNSQRPAVQPLQTQNAFAPQTQQAQRQDPLEALTKALQALEQAVQSLTTKGFNNGQSVAQQATQNLGSSGNSTANQFDWSSLLGGGSTFERPQTQFAAPTPPVQQRQDTSFLGATGGGGTPVADTRGRDNGRHDNGLHLGNERSGGGGTGVRIGSDGANN
jgi:hypothetical protein